MTEQELGGNIRLINFDEMDAQELILAKKIIGNYAKKIRNFKEYQELRIEIKNHSKGKANKFEVNGLLIFDGGNATSNAEGVNPFVLINEVLEKILNEIEHKSRNKEQ